MNVSKKSISIAILTLFTIIAAPLNAELNLPVESTLSGYLIYGGYYKYKFNYEFNTKGKPTEIITYEETNNEWKFVERRNNKYLDDGVTLKKFSSHMNINGEWKETNKYLTEVDEKNRITKQIFYKLEPDYTLWNDHYVLLTYNVHDLIETFITYYKNGITSNFVPYTKITYKYDNNNNVTEEVSQKYKEDVGFVNYAKTENTYNTQDSLINRNSYAWKNNNWEQKAQTIYEYDEKGRITLKHQKVTTPTSNNKLLDVKKDIFEYKDDLLFRHIRHVDVITASGLPFCDIHTYYYRANTNKIDSIVTQVQEDNKPFKETMITNYFYNEDDNLIVIKEKTHLMPDTVNWYDRNRTSYKYYKGKLVGIKNEVYNHRDKTWGLDIKETSLCDEAGNEYAFSPLEWSNKIHEVEIFFKEQLNIIGSNSVENILFPNPAVDYINITNIENISNDIEIHSVLGNKILQLPATNRIDIHSLPTGVYYMKINDKVEKFIKK